MKHVRTTLIKMSKEWGDWGQKTLCGKKFPRGDERLTSSMRWVSCVKCLEMTLVKREREVEYLKWAVEDLRKVGKRRFRTQDMNMGGMQSRY